MANEKIIDRIRKLLELSHSTNEHEAAQAAARAAELMSEHDVTQAMLQVSAEEPTPYIAERIVKDATPDATGRRVAWRDIISRAVAHSLDCKTYIDVNKGEGDGSKCLHAIGRESHVQTWRYMSQYLFAEVEHLADQAWLDNGKDLAAVGQMPRPWKGAFRVGAADTIAARLYAQLAERAGKEKEEINVMARQLSAGNEPLALVRISSTLEVIKKDRQQVTDAFENMTKGWHKTKSPGSSQRAKSGYTSGVEAGKSVNLSGGGKALGAGK